jgi:hypothetical protein
LAIVLFVRRLAASLLAIVLFVRRLAASLLAIVLFVRRLAASHYLFGFFKLFLIIELNIYFVLLYPSIGFPIKKTCS